MPEIVDWRAADPTQVLERIVRDWTAGKLVVLPTENAYEATASGLRPPAVRVLQRLADAMAPALALTSSIEVSDWFPWLGGVGFRLVKRLPLAHLRLQARSGSRFGLLPRLPEEVQSIVATEQYLTVHWPESPLWWSAQRMLRGPVVSVPLRAATTASDAIAALRGLDALVVDAGNRHSTQPATEVRITGKRWEVRREGSISSQQVADAALCRILFVCTGNTCRSPLAEALFVRLLADRLGCAPDELKSRGFLVQSAGLAAMMGEEAAAEAVATAQEFGGDLSRHRSQQISFDLLAQADYVFAMTASHYYALQAVALPNGPVIELLAPTGCDVADPLGGERGVYQRCAHEILGHLQQRLKEILPAT
jgi:L-threonylcarbamoyladenylate synthase